MGNFRRAKGLSFPARCLIPVVIINILFISYAFYPSVGGIESSAILLIREFQRLGCRVVVVTDSSLGDAVELDGFKIHRNPSVSTQYRLGRWADVIYHHNPAFSHWVPSFCGRPTVFSIHTWVSRTDRSMTWKDRVKQAVLARYRCISNSSATADHLKGPSVVIENAYDNTIFRSTIPWDQRTGAVFVGRLVSDKGVPTAIDAIAEAKQRGTAIPLKIIGSGPEEQSLREQVAKQSLNDLVTFCGRLSPQNVAEHLNHAKYCLVPSKWEEPFGIVALEGIGCGCIPLGTNQGGLVDAIGQCGPLFAKDDSVALADWLVRLESEPDLVAEFRSYHADHLEAHSPQTVAQRYLDVFQAAIDGAQR